MPICDHCKAEYARETRSEITRERDQRIGEMTRQGMTAVVIGEVLKVSSRTVERGRERLRKLNAMSAK